MMNEKEEDTKYMEMAIAEAKKDKRRKLKVGAVIVRDGKLLTYAHGGEILEQGEPKGHAEYHALRKAEEENLDLTGATMYTTLEPCTIRHIPKIPCADRILMHNIRKVVIGMLDPNPDIRGTGLARLDRNDVELALAPSDLRDEIQSLNIKFIREQDDMRAVGMRRIYRDHATMALAKAILYAEEEIDIIQTYVQHVNTLEASLLEALKNGVKVRFLLMNPRDNLLVAHRAKDLEKDTGDLEGEIEACIKDIKGIYGRSKNFGGLGEIEVYLYKRIPYIHMYRVDNRIWFSLFLINRFGTSLPHFEVESINSPLGQSLMHHLNELLNCTDTQKEFPLPEDRAPTRNIGEV